MTGSAPPALEAEATREPAAAPGGDGRGQFLRYLGGKLLGAVVSLFVTLNIGFLLFNVIPSDPVGTITRGRQVSAEQKQVLREQLGTDRSLWEKYGHYLDNLVHLRLGYSFQFQESVSSLIVDRLGPTLLLLGISTLLSVVLGLWLGARAGWRSGSAFDRFVSGAAITLWSVPTFWLGLILLVVFAIGIGPLSGLLPSGGMSSPDVSGGVLAEVLDTAEHLVLPVLTLVLVVFAQYLTIMRSSIIDELGSPYLLTARAKGLRDDIVRRRHAVPNALLPSVTVIFLHLGGIIGGAITVETVFSWPGLGYLTYQALQGPDVQVLEGTFLFFSAAVIAMNLVADLLYRALDPRVRAQ
ncbi:peptide/nickel transport system permease protein [Jatrophihabitans endophyticus]|uniref:Peptide/nickel transport system permease protein n=1 Tax=Jatrophihabitans endophyticus TaxID=1206085 RepID=A0A1M5P4S6_9ACTN|nr:ABC transporter permease [Jatrophihabitans endophyticus]SHG96834.1 peptide/nickel transport system permease protein [Jatrophihabitans endophyticus]